jgi:FixJ family two-component response regulator
MMIVRRLIAIVDDNPSILDALQRLLNAYGFATHAYDSAEAFLARANPGNYFGLVLDINLKGMSGIELQLQLAASGSTLPVIFITASDDRAVHDSAMRSGGVACLQKPFAAKQLIAAIEQRAV